MHTQTMKANHELAQYYLERFKSAPYLKKHKNLIADCTVEIKGCRIVIYFPLVPINTPIPNDEWHQYAFSHASPVMMTWLEQAKSLRKLICNSAPKVTTSTLQKWTRKAGLQMIRDGWNETEGFRIICEVR